MSSLSPLLLLGGGYLLLRGKRPPSSSADDSTPAGDASSSASSGSKGGGTSPFKAAAGVLKSAAPVVGAVAGATGLAAPVVAAGLALEAAGGYVGYKLDGTRGAIVGVVNPIIGNSAELGAKAGQAVAGALGFNPTGTAATEGSGAVLGGIASIADIATAAALLPTVGIVVLLAELLGAIFGSDPSAPPTAVDQVDQLYQVAIGQLGAVVGPEDRIAAAAQLVALGNGPASNSIPNPAGAQFPAISIPNLFRLPARAKVQLLGLGSLLT